MPIKDLAPYLLLMQYPAKEKINVEELAQKLGKTQLVVMSLIGHAAKDGTVYVELRKAGYAESQIPAWISRENIRKKRKKAVEGGERVVEGTKNVVDTGRAQQKLTGNIVNGIAIGTGSQSGGAGASSGSDQALPEPASSSPPSPSSDRTLPVSTGGGTTVIKVELPKIPPGGGKQEMPMSFLTPLGQVVEGQELKEKAQETPKEIVPKQLSGFEGVYMDGDEIKRNLAKQGVMMNAEGRWVKGFIENGTIIYRVVNPRDYVKPTEGVGSRISEISMKTIDVQMEGLLRKVALNPEVYMSYTFALNKIDPTTGNSFFEGDLADFINQCVKTTMLIVFGYAPTMAKVRRGILDFDGERVKEVFNVV